MGISARAFSGRLRLRFGLGMLLLLITLQCIFLTLVARKAELQRQAFEAIAACKIFVRSPLSCSTKTKSSRVASPGSIISRNLRQCAFGVKRPAKPL